MGVVYVFYDLEFKQVLTLKTFQEKYLSSKEAGYSWGVSHRGYPVAEIGLELFPLVERCLMKRTEERYGGFDELHKGLERLYEQEITQMTGEEFSIPPDANVLKAYELVISF